MNIIQGILVLYTGEKKKGKKEELPLLFCLSLSTRDRGRPLLLRLSLSLHCSVIAPLYRSDMREKKSCPYFLLLYMQQQQQQLSCVCFV
jgi:hypothetical protein